jgi:hypothetical protein
MLADLLAPKSDYFQNIMETTSYISHPHTKTYVFRLPPYLNFVKETVSH